MLFRPGGCFDGRYAECGQVEVATDAGALCQSGTGGTGSGRKVLLWEGEVIPMQWINKYHKGFNRLWLVFSIVGVFAGVGLNALMGDMRFLILILSQSGLRLR